MTEARTAPRSRTPEALEAEAHEMFSRAHSLLAEAAHLRLSSAAPSRTDDRLVRLSESGLAVRTRRRLERAGRLPVIKLGREKYTRQSALLALLASESPMASTSERSSLSPRDAARAAYAKLSADGGTTQNK